MAFVGAQGHSWHRLPSLPSVRHGLAGAHAGTQPKLPRPELPNSTEAMCRQAAAAVMRAYTDGYTRQAVRLRLDAAYSGQEDLGALLKASLPLAKSFATKLWNGESLKALKTSLVDDDVTTLLYREADNALMDAAVLYLPSREVVTSSKFANFFQSMGDRLVIVTNPENAAANWRVENMGADFYDGSDAGLEICKIFSQQSYYYQLVPINGWQVTFFRAYPFPWELWIEDLNYNLVKLGEFEQKPSYEQIVAWTEAYEESIGIRAFQKVGKLLQDNQQRIDPDEASLALSAS
eukprot:CAMPEP_0114664384 /NCGR_PEP_ID=MMETSP0191-20121206/28733_1 /TAXON_ID=126664 /ORGANISM="Sorites sp." /LENGTH=291 /DNA_ID=CAMNT_0001906431 /DNA_START=126 /DNA_END=1001 /DNA_ORIENTATION=+